MARTPRKEVFQEDEVGIYHCINRCVRRAFLCGRDPYTGKSFGHRKDWIHDRLKQLARIFGVDVLGFAVLDNHLHVVLRNRPDGPMKNFGRWFRRAAGRHETLASTASRRGRRWLHGMGRSRIAFA